VKALTINDLLKECKKQVAKGNGDKTIMISSDDEGNSYHYLWYSFTSIEEYEKPMILPNGKEYKENFYFTSNNVASKEDTIILG
jgi:hypothetical protein